MNENSPTAQATLERHTAPVTFDVETINLDVPAVAAALSQRLRVVGLPVTPERAVNFAQALTLVSPLSRRQLYWTARAVLVTSPAHLLTFDYAFASVFGSWRHADERLNPEAVEDSRDDRAA